ncbi:MAG: BtpA/SgcQ family protein [Caldilinea sp.]|nr:BtpA/SgcQ family protein [Caldilinea sp.]
MNWIRELFGVHKPIIAMCHLRALPGDPGYDAAKGLDFVLEKARADLHALQAGGVDAVMFSNEYSTPYLLQVEPITHVTMARIIGELRSEIQVPYGVNVLWDPKATVELAVAVDASFVREIFSGVYASDFGLWNTYSGEVARLRQRLGGDKIKLFYNIVPEAAAYLGSRDIAAIARSTEFNAQPDALCVSGLIAGAETDAGTLAAVKGAVQRTPVFANTGVRADNVAAQLAIADGAIVGTTFKVDGYIWSDVDQRRVAEFMQAARAARG